MRRVFSFLCIVGLASFVAYQAFANFSNNGTVGQCAGDLTGTYPNCTVAKVNGGTPGGGCPANQYTTSISSAAAPSCARPSTGDISGLGSIATQAANAVALTGGNIDGTAIGANTPAAVTATTLTRSMEIETGFNIQATTTGFNITVGAGVGTQILNPAGTLATGTVKMPAAPVNGQILKIRSTQIITALTLSANTGQSIVGAVGTLALGGQAECMYQSSNTTWYC